jgi:hypothetical protein
MTDFSDLPAGEQAKRYRQLAEDALREAGRGIEPEPPPESMRLK